MIYENIIDLLKNRKSFNIDFRYEKNNIISIPNKEKKSFFELDIKNNFKLDEIASAIIFSNSNNLKLDELSKNKKCFIALQKIKKFKKALLNNNINNALLIDNMVNNYIFNKSIKVELKMYKNSISINQDNNELIILDNRKKQNYFDSLVNAIKQNKKLFELLKNNCSYKVLEYYKIKNASQIINFFNENRKLFE